MAASSKNPPCCHEDLNSIFLNAETVLFLHQVATKSVDAAWKGGYIVCLSPKPQSHTCIHPSQVSPAPHVTHGCLLRLVTPLTDYIVDNWEQQ